MPAERSERFRRGLEMIRRMFPNAETRDHPVAAPVRRDWGLYTVETVMGEVWSRPGLSPRDRSAITIAALTALHYPNELRLHLRGALRNGLSHQELSEVILHMRAYAGAPAALEGLMVAEEVFQELPQPDAPPPPPTPARSDEDRLALGRATARAIFPRGALRGLPVPAEIADDWSAYAVATTFGDVWSRPGLDLQTRSRITLAALTVLHRPDELRLHLRAARHLGLSRAEICEVLLHLSIYGGFPAAVTALRIAREVFDAEGGD